MKTILLLFIMSAGTAAWAQQKETTKDPILYDPSFWKEELKLNKVQYKRMQDINKEFYDRLFIAFREMKNDRSAFRDAYARCWVSRNTQLWETMNPRQKRKWKKITVAKHMADTDVSMSHYE